MTTSLQRSTASELFEMPDDGFRYELVKGELRKMSPSGSEHGAIIIIITLLLAQYVKANKLGVCFGAETGFKIASDPDTVRAPDVAFTSRERIPVMQRRGYGAVAPDLVAEVLSPDDRPSEVLSKVGDWLAAGVRLAFVVDPEQRRVRVYRADGSQRDVEEGELLDGEDVLPGFHCHLGDFLD